MEESFVKHFTSTQFKEKLDIIQNYKCILTEFYDELSHTILGIGFKLKDQFAEMSLELIKTRYPSKALSQLQEDRHFIEHTTTLYINTADSKIVFFPESKTAYRILSDPDFTELRTNRNRNRISKEDQIKLGACRIGIVGMSVGRSALTTLAHEGIGSQIKIADSDTLELSNLNRIKTGFTSLGELKTMSAAKEIAELNPFLDVVCYNEGLNQENIDSFLTEGGNLDIVIDECDDLAMKVHLRRKARSLGIPVVMETSDRGMLDIERFDLEPERPLFHGRLSEEININDLNNMENRMNALLNIVDINNVSDKGRMSLAQIGKELLSWPQLASAVSLGGALIAHACRGIILNTSTSSGRYYVDLNELIK